MCFYPDNQFSLVRTLRITCLQTTGRQNTVDVIRRDPYMWLHKQFDGVITFPLVSTYVWHNSGNKKGEMAWRHTPALHTTFQECSKGIQRGWAVLWGSLSGMDTMVQCEGWAPGEGLATLSALVGLFSGVNSPMQNKVWVSVESFSTLATFIGLLPCVDSLVLCEVWALAEGFATLITFVGFFSRVDALVQDEIGAMTECFATLGTFMRLLSCVDSLV